MLSDKLFKMIQDDGLLPEGSYLIKDYQMFGECPTYKLPDGTLRFYWRSKMMDKQELYADLRANWRPVHSEEQNWFIRNLG